MSKMTKIRKLFRGSGRILGLIFAASIIWLIFDMAALRFSFTEINSKLSKEEFLRLERLRSKVLQDEGLHKMFRRRPGGGLAGGDAPTRAPRGNPATSSRQPGGAVGFRRNKEVYRARAAADQLLLAAPATVWKEPDPQPTRRRGDRPELADRTTVAAARTTAGHPGQVVAASAPAFLPGPGEKVSEVRGLKPRQAAVNAELKAVTEREGEGQVNRGGLGGERGVKPAEGKAGTNRAGTAVAAGPRADGLGHRVSPPGGGGWTTPNASVQAVGAVLMKNTVNQSHSEVWNGLKGGLVNITDNKIPVGGRAWNGVKGESVNITDSKISAHSKIWKGTPGELDNITVTKNVGLKQNIIKYTPLINATNKTAINHLEGKNTPRITEKRDFSVNVVKKVVVKNNETNDQRIGDKVLPRSVASLGSAIGVHRVLSIDRTISPRNPEAVGQFGQPAVVPKEQEERAKEKWNEGHFNVHLSNMIPLDRGVPDTRPKGCPDQMVHNNLPTTSIILCFVDEVWSTLLRSVHSIFNRSPAHLIKEVILVDDFSTREYLKENLDIYMSQFPKVHVIHLQERHGLIRARLVGAANATGDVLTFLDSHVECNVGWLEPLLERIHLKRTKVACPVIEVISDEDMSYIGVNGFLRGVFTWPMNFGWKTIPDEIIKRYNLTEMDPIKCPIMAGGLFSIDKKYFYELGTYDTGLEVWGGENMELSFKVWMCGGEIEIIPCSRVGHIFRDGNPYTFPKDRIKTVERNLARVAEVWLDEYVDVFYGHGYHHLLNTNNIEFNIGDLSKQKELREKLQCRSFKWYLENVYPDIQTSLVRSDGLLFNVGTRKCLAVENGTFSFELCDINEKNQHFNHSWLRLIQQKDLCIALLDMKREIGMKPCDKKSNNLRWLHQSYTAESTLTDHILWEISQFPLCLEGNLFGKVLMINSCDPANPRQKWKFTNYYKD
ncbi:polypeptide N-acetylgalactosaminyltransferase 5 [Pristis pectinata]|uniref:polypeptide N-acetylgalactosaminyltransferase 5 n=1 Tax=Pristis pectinata TaxID=685728 RepID=UPI00223DB4B5|nr:polypeptide N-acetylgalactosaminyltransferase 5 [Pristis pectinata]